MDQAEDVHFTGQKITPTHTQKARKLIKVCESNLGLSCCGVEWLTTPPKLDLNRFLETGPNDIKRLNRCIDHR